MFSIEEIGERLRTQDNRITADPMFLVQELKRHYGIDTDYSDDIAWRSAEYDEVSPAKSKKLEAKYRAGCSVPNEYTRTAYRDEWTYVMCFFTEAAADFYIKTKSHHHNGKLRTYAGSAHDNPEWKAIRKLLMEAK